MKLKNVRAIVELCCVNDVEPFIKIGWILLDVKPPHSDRMDDELYPLVYSLGWEKDDKPKYPS
jgi:hypothetical protein